MLFSRIQGFYQQQFYFSFSSQNRTCSFLSCLFCTVMLLYVEDLLRTSPCYLLIVHRVQQRNCVVLVLVLTLLTCISCWLPTLHLVDNSGFVKSSLSLLSLSFHWLKAELGSWTVGYIWSKGMLIRKHWTLSNKLSNFLTVGPVLTLPTYLIADFSFITCWLNACHLEWVPMPAAWMQRCVAKADFRGEPTSTKHIKTHH